MLMRSSRRSQGVYSTVRVAPVSATTTRTSHAAVVTKVGRGKGGGAPVGLRWRRAFPAAEPGGRAAWPSRVATGSMSSLTA